MKRFALTGVLLAAFALSGCAASTDGASSPDEADEAGSVAEASSVAYFVKGHWATCHGRVSYIATIRAKAGTTVTTTLVTPTGAHLRATEVFGTRISGKNIVVTPMADYIPSAYRLRVSWGGRVRIDRSIGVPPSDPGSPICG